MLWKNKASFLISYLLVILVLAAGTVSCGYAFQTSHNPYSDEGLNTLYIQHLANATPQPGVEDLVYNSLTRALLARGRWKLVASESAADVVLGGTVSAAAYSVANLQQVQSLLPALGQLFSTSSANIPAIAVAQSYSAVLGYDLVLKRSRSKPGQSPVLWTHGFSKGKQFPSANQLDVPGTTAPLINQSEFERALTELSGLIATDAEESMFSRF